MKYIITGYKGLIGHELRKRLDEAGHECKMTYDLKDNQDINKIDKLKRNADIVFHLAAHCKINEGTLNPKLPFEANVCGIYHLLEFCRKNNIKKVVVFSSSRVLSKEENPYTASKKYCEYLTKAYYDCYGIEYIIIRPSTVYAPCDDKTGRLLTNWCRDAWAGRELKIFGDENKTLDFTHINDFNDGVMLLINNWEQTKNKAYNISGKDETKLVYVAEMINEITPVSVVFYPQEIAQPQKVSVDISEMEKLGYSPKIKIEEGIKEMMEYYRKEAGK